MSWPTVPLEKIAKVSGRSTPKRSNDACRFSRPARRRLAGELVGGRTTPARGPVAGHRCGSAPPGPGDTHSTPTPRRRPVSPAGGHEGGRWRRAGAGIPAPRSSSPPDWWLRADNPRPRCVGTITRGTALGRLTGGQYKVLCRPRALYIAVAGKDDTAGLPAYGGVAGGVVAPTSTQAVDVAAKGSPVVPVRQGVQGVFRSFVDV